MTIPVGLTIRNMGVESSPSLIRHCALSAEKADLHSVWITDHIAIPPDDAEGSGGRYLDPLATLSWIGGQTSKIMLGTGVIVLPYRPKLATAKWVATVQELTDNRLILGTGIGWMRAEFNAVGVPLEKRVSVSEETLAFLNDCFENEVVEANGQPFLFKPRPEKPPILLGGGAPHATDRAARLCDGWLPMTTDVEKLKPAIQDYRAAAEKTGRSSLVYAFGRLGTTREDVRGNLNALEDIGVNAVITGVPYSDETSFTENFDKLVDLLP